MATILNLPLRQLQPELIFQLKKDYPKADFRVETQAGEPSGLLTESRFWEIIGLFDWTDSENNEQVIRPAVEALAASPVHHIYLFADLLATKLHALDRRDLAENIGEDSYSPGQFFSVDNFLYARCCVIANGKAALEAVLAEPSLMPKNLTFESLLRVASLAYLAKTGRPFEYVSETPIETFQNRAGWPIH